MWYRTHTHTPCISVGVSHGVEVGTGSTFLVWHNEEESVKILFYILQIFVCVCFRFCVGGPVPSRATGTTPAKNCKSCSNLTPDLLCTIWSSLAHPPAEPLLPLHLSGSAPVTKISSWATNVSHFPKPKIKPKMSSLGNQNTCKVDTLACRCHKCPFGSMNALSEVSSNLPIRFLYCMSWEQVEILTWW